MKISPVSGKELYGLFQSYNPFGPDLMLKPEKERKTILAANVNFPLELGIAAFAKAASLDGGSPLIIQFSGNALLGAGLGVASANEVDCIRALRLGAKIALTLSSAYIHEYKAPFVALGLDHFALPHVILGSAGHLFSEEAKAYAVTAESAVSMLERAADFSSSYLVPSPSLHEFETWSRYLSSPAYAESVAGFLACLEELNPGWAMIDTEEMPPVLNYAVTRHVCELVRGRGFDVILEAEYGRTGQSGEDESYVELRGPHLHRFARQIAGFVKYTGAKGISYPIGLEHAAPLDRRHEPDIERLKTVQGEIIREVGYYVPFAQHGGTGAKQLARGLVAKNNVNTQFLVAMAQNLARHFRENEEPVERGQKSACSSRIYVAAAQAAGRAAVQKMMEGNTYGGFADRRRD